MVEDLRARGVLLWSGEHHAYWRPNSAGYTIDGLAAGVYDRAEAERIIAGCDPEKKVSIREIDPVWPVLSFASSAAGQREGCEHGLGPGAAVVEDDPDGFNPVIVQVGEAVYVAQADEMMVMSRSQAIEVAAIIASLIASPSAPEERRDEVDRLREAVRLSVAYDDLLRSYAGPLCALCEGDAPLIDAAYDRWIAAARAALTPVPGERPEPPT